MRRKYSDCQRDDGDCSCCSLVNQGLDCHSRLITKLEMCRRRVGLTQAQVAQAAGIPNRSVQKVEAGECQTGNLTAKKLLAISDAIGVDIRDLI